MLKNKKIIISIIIFFAILLFNKPAYAMTQEEAGQALANFAVDFYKNYGSETAYSYTYRANSYPGVRTSGYTDASGQYVSEPFTDKYAFDCVGWISFAVHNCLGLGEESFTEFGIPPHNPMPGFSHGFELVLGNYSNPVAISEDELYSKARPGDLFLATGQHILLYVGEGYVVDSCGGVPTLLYRKIQGTGYGICAVGRITEDAAKGINKDNVGTMFQDSYLDGSFNYNGIPKGSYKGSYSSLSWLFENVLGFFDYLIGMLFYIIRAPFVGWANIIEVMINDTINNLSGVEMSSATVEIPKDDGEGNTENLENTENIENTENTDSENNEEKTVKVRTGGYFIPSAKDMYEVDGSKRINIEHIIYNQVPILDVDFFDVDLSDYKGSETIAISEDSIIYKIRENVAIWYNIIRSFSIISLVIVLIYLGIRLAISTTAGTKAKYKSMLTAWVTSFIIIFAIHYFMVAVIEVNERFLEVFKAVEVKYTGGLSMYDTIRTRAYSVKLSEGLPATVMYMVLIYFLIRFLFIYIKRYFTVNILALMGPIMGIKYAIDKINTGKSGTMGPWMYDFALNVLLQSVHALIYTIFMVIAFEVGMESIPGFILSLFIMNFIFKAEKIFLDVFKFNGRSSSLSDVNKNTNYFLEAYKISKGLAFFPGVAFGLVKNTTKAVGGLVLDTAQLGVDFGTGVLNVGDAVISKIEKTEANPYQTVNVREKMKNALDFIKGGAANVADDALYKITGVRSLRLGLNRLKKTDKKAYLTTKALLDSNKKLKKQTVKRYLSGSVKSIKTIASLTTSIPMMVVDPESGFTMFATTVGDIKDLTLGKPHYGHRTKKEIKGRRGRIVATLLTGVGAYAVNSAADNLKEFEKDRKKIVKNELMLADLREAHMLEGAIEEQVKLINKELEAEKQAQTTKEAADKVEDTINALKAETISRTLDTVLATKDIKSIVHNYMERNDLETLGVADIENIIREFNIHNIKGEITQLTGIDDSKIKQLREKAQALEEQIRTGVDKANNPIDRKKVQKQLDSTNGKIEQAEVAKKVGEAIERDGDLSEGMIIEKHTVQNLIKEYKKDTQKEKLEDSDISKIVEMFNSRVTENENNTPTSPGTDKKEDKIPMYASKEDLMVQFTEPNKKLKDKKSVVLKTTDGNPADGRTTNGNSTYGNPTYGNPADGNSTNGNPTGGRATVQGIKSKKLDQKEAVNAILDANKNRFVKQSEDTRQESKQNAGAEKYDHYSVLSDLLRDLETLNQRSINTFDRSVTDMRKIKEIIKNNKFKK